jgi:two-component system, cell cycle response regulator DivK
VSWSSHKGVIYLVDDDAEFLVTLQEALEGAGYYVLPARDGNEALARMRGLHGKSLAIVDLIMPRMSGWDLIETMRADQSLSKIPILAVSSEVTLKKGPKATGADRMLAKPFDVSKLLRTVDELLIN